MKKFIITLTAMIIAVTAVARKPRLDLYRDEQPTDTVYSSTYYLVAVTDPGAQAWIKGKPCKVYKTGSFGAEIKLNEGENMIPVKVQEGKNKTQRDVRLVYVKRLRNNNPILQDTPLPTPLNVVTLDGAYLQNGNGNDRLGGSKMGFIGPDIPLTAVAECGDLYRVALGQSRYAYLPKEYATEGGEGCQTVNTSSASITNIGRADRLSISLPRRLPFSYTTEINPCEIKIKLYGATNNSNWITQRNALGMIDFVDFRQEDSDMLTIVIRLKEKYAWGYSVNYEGNNLVIDVRHRPVSLEIKDLVIGLDAGHGGEFPGAVSPSGLTEKEVNLDIVLKAKNMLEQMGSTVVLTRDSDTGPSMSERKKIWRDANVDIAISVHNNASGNPLEPMGTSVYYKHLSNLPLATALHDSMLGLGVADYGLTGNFNFSLNGPTEYPNALVECLFMSSLPEEELLADDAYRAQIARHIVDGLLNYLSTVKSLR